MTNHRASGETAEFEDKQTIGDLAETSDVYEVLMSILMLSAQHPEGISKEDILAVLATYHQEALYSLCEDEDLKDDEEDEPPPDEPEAEASQP